MTPRGNDHGANLLVGEELDAGIREDSQESGGVTAEEPPGAVGAVNVLHGGCDAEPGASVFGELGAVGLEEDLDAVKRCDYGFALRIIVISIRIFVEEAGSTYRASCQAARGAGLP